MNMSEKPLQNHQFTKSRTAIANNSKKIYYFYYSSLLEVYFISKLYKKEKFTNFKTRCSNEKCGDFKINLIGAKIEINVYDIYWNE